jgi:alkaline phosphatase D
MTSFRLVVLLLAVGAAVTFAPGATRAVGAAEQGPIVSHGVAVGDVRSDSAVLWARADRAATLHVGLSGGRHDRVERLDVTTEHDFTGQVLLSGLRPGTTYRYSVRFRADRHGPKVEGSFATAPAAAEPAPVRLAFGGDLAGQNVCRDAAEGFPLLEQVREFRPDVFVGLGDMIYADNLCAAAGRYGNAQVPGDFVEAATTEEFWQHWRYTRADEGLQRLLAETGYVGVWDDHEVVNDFGPLHDTGATPPYPPGVHLLPIGLQAFLDYTPIASSEETPKRLYRSLRYGKHLELFVLDTRQYRDANGALDSPERPKTMLGREQLTWLQEKLAGSDATWKVVVSSVPMSIPTGFPAANGRDGWANFDQQTGFEHELLAILDHARDHGVENLFWITTDVHFAEAFRYRPVADDPGFVVHELATGPMNAGIFPIRDVDPTLAPEVLAFVGPATPADVVTWADAKRWFTFGALEIGADGRLTARIVDTAGTTRFRLELEPT